MNVTETKMSLGHKLPLAALVSLAVLSGCARFDGTLAPALNEQGAATEAGYAVTAANAASVRVRALQTLNNSRLSAGVAPVALDPALTQAADGHSRDMARQSRPWLFGTDGSSPVQRAERAGFTGTVIGEVISETFETEVQAVATWMGQPAQRSILLDPAATRVGVGVFQEPSMKFWWTLTVAK